MNCKICNKKYESPMGLARHFTQKHKISSKTYYDLYLKTSETGICKADGCNKQTRYVNIVVGYRDFCSERCAAIIHRFNLKNNEEKFNSFRDKVSLNQTQIWKNRDDTGEKIIIFNKVSKTSKLNNSKMTVEERNVKFGWLNKLQGKERTDKINEILDCSLRKWMNNASPAEKLDRIEKARMTKMGDRYFADVYKDFQAYRENIYSLTNRCYNKYKDIINPLKLHRGIKYNDYQLDHKYSIVQGYIDNVPVEIMSSIYNLEMLTPYDNIKKRIKCSITKEELIGQYNGEYYE